MADSVLCLFRCEVEVLFLMACPGGGVRGGTRISDGPGVGGVLVK